MIGLIEKDDYTSYLNEISNFVKYSNDYFLEMNVEKTKEMVIDFKKKTNKCELVKVIGRQIERVETYKYLGVVFNNKLTWSNHIWISL